MHFVQGQSDWSNQEDDTEGGDQRAIITFSIKTSSATLVHTTWEPFRSRRHPKSNTTYLYKNSPRPTQVKLKGDCEVHQTKRHLACTSAIDLRVSIAPAVLFPFHFAALTNANPSQWGQPSGRGVKLQLNCVKYAATMCRHLLLLRRCIINMGGADA